MATRKCVFFQLTNPNNCTEPETCHTIQECETPCHAVYSNVGGILIWQIAGCDVGSSCENDDGDECHLRRLHHLQPSNQSSKYYMCCCTGNLCNINIVKNKTLMNYRPTTTPYMSTELTQMKQPTGLKAHHLGYVLPPVFAAIILLAVIFLICKVMRRKHTRDPLLPASPKTTPRISAKPLLKKEVISRGQFGCVWRAEYENELVAVKVIQAHEKASWEVEKRMFTEYGLKHDNLLSFVNAEVRCENNIYEYLIITEFHEYGSLSDYLHRNIIDLDMLMNLTHSMVSGLTYLHCNSYDKTPSKPSISHRDFKIRNILVKSDLTCCISDLGSACVFYPGVDNIEARAQVGTKRYMAPEVLQGSIVFKAEAYMSTDVYAMALVMWELLSRCNETTAPVEDYRAPYEDEVGIHPTIEDMRICVLDNKSRPLIKAEWRTDHRLKEYCETIEQCWDDEADARLTANCVQERLRFLMESPNDCQTVLGNRINGTDYMNGKVVVELSDTKPEFSYSSIASSRRTQDTTC